MITVIVNYGAVDVSFVGMKMSSHWKHIEIQQRMFHYKCGFELFPGILSQPLTLWVGIHLCCCSHQCEINNFQKDELFTQAKHFTKATYSSESWMIKLYIDPLDFW